MKSLTQQFKETWSAAAYAGPQQQVLLAVSGGVDSMAMAHLFLSCKIPMAVAHCNFGLRAEESDKDEQLVAEWCKTNSVTFHVARFDTKQKTVEWKKGTQETARILRYEWFEEIRKENNYAKVVTAHHAGDNVETLLMNLFKGTGISGLHGIPTQNGYVVRPLLFATKEMLSAYVAENNIPFRQDASNETDDYTRNAVRRNIIPAITQWFPNAVQHINEGIARFAEAEMLYNKQIEHHAKKLLEVRGKDVYVPVLKLKKSEALSTLCYELFKPYGFTPGQVVHILELLDAGTGHYITSHSHRIIRNRDFLIVTTIPADAADLLLIEGVPCTVETDGFSYSFSIEKKPETISPDKSIAYIDIKGVDFPLVFRKWRMGDYFYPLGMQMKKKKVARLLIDEKVPLHEKEHVRILECNRRVAWVSGIRPDERFKVKDTTEKVLVVTRKALL